MFGHVFDDLAAYAEQQLDAARRAHVEQHLLSCERCRQSLRRIVEGINYATELSPQPMPAELAAELKHQLTQSPLPRDASRAPGTRRVQWSYAAATILMTIAGIGLYWQVNRPWVRLHAASAAPTRFEAEGRALHDRIAAGNANFGFESDDEQALWRWLSSQQAPVTSMVVSRPEADRAQFVPIGASVHTLGGVRTSLLSYRIDGRPVTLVLANASHVPDRPAAGWWSKRVMHRRDAGGVNTLTWTVGGGTYVMVSELGDAGQRACLICHTAPTFRERISDIRRH
jgi:anti-sigma factor RsiW